MDGRSTIRSRNFERAVGCKSPLSTRSRNFCGIEECEERRKRRVHSSDLHEALAVGLSVFSTKFFVCISDFIPIHSLSDFTGIRYENSVKVPRREERVEDEVEISPELSCRFANSSDRFLLSTKMSKRIRHGGQSSSRSPLLALCAPRRRRKNESAFSATDY